ncbi:MAG: quinol dehydrogenase ferredoxin subunit NapH [Rhodoferax sp.]
MSRPRLAPGHEAQQRKGWWLTHRFLVLRRVSQGLILFLFLMGPWLGWWLVKGNLNYSLTLGVLPLADPLVQLQVLLSGHVPQRNAILGALLIVLFYALVGGRVYCAWVCPVNLVTDAANALRRRLELRGGADLPKSARFWVLGLILALAAATGSLVWELVNPVSMLPRGLMFGMGAGWLLIAGIFLFDLFVAERGWCGHLCPVGAFYSLLGRRSVLRVSAARRQDCNDCLDCFTVCPEQQVIKLPLKGERKGVGPVITSSQCTNCGRCIDVCGRDVFVWHPRWGVAGDAAPVQDPS